MAFDPNKDYAAAIKNETDPNKKLQLQQERQEKIDAMNNSGTNNKGYTNNVYKGWSNGKYTGSSSNKNNNTISSSWNSWQGHTGTSTGSSSSNSNKNNSSSSSGYYNPNLDYAAEIAKQQALNNISEVQKLMQERQNKIDALNASNLNKWGATNSIYNYSSNNNSLGYDPNKDYAAEISKQQALGNYTEVQKLIAEREKKIAALNAANMNKWGATNSIYGQNGTTGNQFSENWKDYSEGWDWNAETISRDDLQNRINQIIRSMQANSAMYNTATNKDQLARENEDYANQLRRLGIQVAQLTPGSWYYMNRPVYDGHIYDDNGTGYYKLYDVPQISPFDNMYADKLIAQGGMYVGTSSPSMPSVYDIFGNIGDLQSAAIDEQLKALQAQLENQKNENNAYYDDIARQAYIAMRQGETGLAQRLAASGISGGMTETTQLGMMADYQNRLNDNEIARQQMMQDLDYQNLLAQVQANSDKANLQADLQLQAYNAAMQQQQMQWQQEMYEREWARQEEQDLWNRLQYENSLKLQMNDQEWQSRQYEIELALEMGDYQKLSQMGYNTYYLQQLQKYELQSLAQKAMMAAIQA